MHWKIVRQTTGTSITKTNVLHLTNRLDFHDCEAEACVCWLASASHSLFMESSQSKPSWSPEVQNTPVEVKTSETGKDLRIRQNVIISSGRTRCFSFSGCTAKTTSSAVSLQSKHPLSKLAPWQFKRISWAGNNQSDVSFTTTAPLIHLLPLPYDANVVECCWSRPWLGNTSFTQLSSHPSHRCPRPGMNQVRTNVNPLEMPRLPNSTTHWCATPYPTQL